MTKKLLIIDDSVDIHEVIEEITSHIFAEIQSATSVSEAIDELSKNIFDCIILDINLSGKNGAEVIKFLIENKNANSEKPFIIVSGLIGNTFVGKYKKRFAGVFSKPFDHEEFLECIDKALHPEKVILSDAMTAIPEVKCDLPFSVPFIEERVASTLNMVRKNSRLKDIFENLKIDRSENNYILAHIGLLINISTAIAMSMEWNTEKTLAKFVYAAYLHDLALSDNVKLARIKDLQDLESQKPNLTKEEYNLVLDHPILAATRIDEIEEIPSDVVHIVKQHHEIGMEFGFPLHINVTKISPISAVFIVAHDLTDYILDNTNWSYEDYLKKYRNKFKGAVFTKVLSSLEKCLKDLD